MGEEQGGDMLEFLVVVLVVVGGGGGRPSPRSVLHARHVDLAWAGTESEGEERGNAHPKRSKKTSNIRKRGMQKSLQICWPGERGVVSGVVENGSHSASTSNKEGCRPKNMGHPGEEKTRVPRIIHLNFTAAKARKSHSSRRSERSQSAPRPRRMSHQPHALSGDIQTRAPRACPLLRSLLLSCHRATAITAGLGACCFVGGPSLPLLLLLLIAQVFFNAALRTPLACLPSSTSCRLFFFRGDEPRAGQKGQRYRQGFHGGMLRALPSSSAGQLVCVVCFVPREASVRGRGNGGGSVRTGA